MIAGDFPDSDASAKNHPLTEAQQTDLYKQIQDFSIDPEDAQLTFLMRLVRENAWPLDYAERVIEEYKKFVFLWVVAAHPVTPSDQVDQAWHLHLSYTHSYWERLCKDVLQAAFHHHPTRGGQAEGEKFDGYYRQTLESYETFFAQVPPEDIWPAPEDRFGRDVSFVRVNTQTEWIVPKPPISRVMASWSTAALLFMFSLYAATATGSVENPVGAVFLSATAATAGFSLIQLLARFLESLNSPPLPAHLRAGGCGGCGYSGCGGCGGGGCGGG